jgi:type I restriction enzyme S subunit
MSELKFKYNTADKPWAYIPLGDLTKKYRVLNTNIHNSNLLSLSYGKIVQKDIESKKGLLPSSFDTYQVIKKDIIVFRVTDLQNDKKSLRVGLSTQEGIISPAYVCMECDTNKINPMFLYLVLHYHDIVTKVYYHMGDGLRQTLTYDDLKSLMIPIPSFEEQAEIVSYFTTTENLIQASAKKVESLKQLKAASMISMFPQKGETRPRIRFKGFDGDWSCSKLSQYATRIVRKNQKLETSLPLTISAVDGLVAQDTFFNSKIASSNLQGYYLLKKGEFAYNKSYSNGYPFGAVKRLEKYPMGALSVLYIVFELNENISHDYMTQFFETTLWYGEIAKRAAEGARNHGLLNISAEDFLDIQIVFPKSIEEQNKIASFFRNLDMQISLETQRLEKLKQIKSACLDKMFV